ncbi:DUF2812 domain-containing protein [Anaerovorax sp. IOR16]|uniref:DUF2812 domain-containing protein n=1 Tax=Anaerovorax sp. IOR16 TaxID=2773458 RepID=UPI0019CF8BCB|nr:DUF2812 domain-containing protein [Anaerovorax sp. IOR16]
MCKNEKRNVVYRLRPDEYYRIGEHESWFMDLAERGLHLEKMGVRFARFQRGEPKKMQYRVDLFPGIEDPLGQQQKDFYKQYGWEYVTKYGKFCVYRSPNDANAPELHTDMEEQAYTIKELEKTLRNTTLFVLLMVALIVVMTFLNWFVSKTPILHLIEGGSIQQAFLILVEVYIAITSILSWFAIRRLRNDLKAGYPINHHAPWKKRKYFTFGIAVTFTVLAFMTCLIPIMQMTQTKEATLPLDIESKIPVVRLAEIEQDERLERLTEENFVKSAVDFNNNYESKWMLLAKSSFESRECGIINTEIWKDGSGVYSPSITCDMINLHFKILAVPLAKEWISYYGRPEELAYEGERFVNQEDERFDFLSVHESDASLQICAVKEKKVMFVRYYGYADTQNVINAIAKSFKNT